VKYIKKPVEIEAFVFVGGSVEPGWPIGWLSVPHVFSDDGESVIIPTLEGDHRADKGDYIIKGIKGEFYPCKPDIFVLTYEPTWPSGQDEAREFLFSLASLNVQDRVIAIVARDAAQRAHGRRDAAEAFCKACPGEPTPKCKIGCKALNTILGEVKGSGGQPPEKGI
jgi:hypothetical protein